MLQRKGSDLKLNLKSRNRLNMILLNMGSLRLLRFVSPSPDWAEIRVTESCSSRCTTCYAWKSSPEGKLTIEEIKRCNTSIKYMSTFAQANIEYLWQV